MADVILFHHAQGLTSGVHAFADELRSAGHTLTVPDLYEGRTFDDLQSGVDHAQAIGFDEIVARGVAAAQDVPSATVFAGFSLGVMPAQKLAQTRQDATGALLLHGVLPIDHFAESWPAGVPAQIHVMQDDDWGDVDIARDIAATVPHAELFLYPGDQHLFTDRSLAAYDEVATSLLLPRVLAFLDRLS